MDRAKFQHGLPPPTRLASQCGVGVDPVPWTVSGLILKPSGVLCRRTMGRACRH